MPASRPTASALVKGLEWQQWWTYWRARVPERQPWMDFLADGLTRALEAQIRMSRVLRQGAPWEARGWTPAEWEDQLAVAEAALAWFRRERPTLAGVPAWAEVPLTALEGLFVMQTRLARELMAVKRQGYALVNVSPRAAEPLGAPPADGQEEA